MTRYQKGGLSHHEELRYFYLLRNLNYLTETERREFTFLKSKMESRAMPSRSQRSLTHYTRGGRDDYAQASQDNADVYYTSDEQQAGPNGLPLYPRSERRSKRHQQKPILAPQQDFYDDPDQAIYEELAPEAMPKKGRRKKKKGRLRRFFRVLFFLLLLLVAGIAFMFFKGMMDVSTNKANYKPAVSQVFHGQDTSDGTNILILGSDQRITQGSTDARTDTIMVVNVGNKENKIKMVSFMRDTLVNIPGYSYNNQDSYDLKLNASFNLGEQENHQGAEFVRQTLKHNFDIDIKYYVMVDFETFAEAIDTLFPDGVTIDAKFATVNGEAVDAIEVPDDLRMKDGVVPNQTITVGEQKMDGRTLLNYARFRKDDEGDFGRTVRQQQVMAAIMSQIKDPTKLFTGSAAIGKIYALTSTNVSFPFVLKNGVSVLTNGKNGVEHVTIPENGDWIDEYDMYGGQALFIDFAKYQNRLSKLGLR
ncbi:TPA: LCP family protein [Streptococcus equi subsp. zooepidemicus]|uniref:LCP family protein n=1 Tax=Streptococcus equi TaxID=1336 RepID=UPI000F6DF812|nr:cell envelope-related transcriptional attenuator domain protein [Streptococcus equi subsp. equi]HEL0021431.1 LCP family protein [Streptococcus equi subsp. zooepidemicus]HEL0039622.1 LCP family protein [Streptococcus equi subsp. zooepidemicus]HEL0041660.1 LCP family protein [Streptococcus equi subsp. zooepidemicus]HEL0043716.1 LCP family protein [Streptococcus equi subsp. zooepidemicus]